MYSEQNLELTQDEETERPGETKSEKFSRLAIPRMNRLIMGIESLSKLGNRSSYDYTEEQVTKMFETLRQNLDTAESKFKPKMEKGKGNFTF